MDWQRFKSRVPEGRAGDWTVEKFEVTARDEEFERMRAFNPSSMGRFTPAGNYTAWAQDLCRAKRSLGR